MKRAFALALVALSSCTTTADTRGPELLAEALEGRVAGETRQCVGFTQSGRSFEIIDAITLLYHESSARVWRNNLRDACPGLHRDDILVLEPFGSQYCRNDRVRAVDRNTGFAHAYCLLGDFVAYDKPKARTD